MAKHTGPVCKICRREGEKLFLKGDRCHTEKCSFDRRPYPPGEHGKSNLRKKQSDFGLHLREKQKVKRMYNLMEQQFRNYYKKADQTKGMTGLMLLQFLERRLDNIVFRLNFAPSRKAARQLVTHSHFSVNGKSVRIPSFIVDEGDEIEIKENKRDKKIFKVAMEVAKQNPIVEWLEVDPDKFKGIVKRLPEREDMPQNIKENLVVEYYSK
ncbi:MAG: 30S ribosomal protein S4 [Candidatus Mcinerneyibacterium aminivorans]|jgi:small subunit ribosomal protein S4|uniref:Small ribosomal subunit protein uS4 n=1 Tax=Candidatus Mcinerneyibacterium aminivorans TaxID=2703815 RepID=A0A5D0MC39_9BACT|nr:MAG: 30S ribosomal protein S4 [Candidatus Mcinerneyibacterium aminivorans]